MDPTLNQGILRHEFGEAAAGRGPLSPVASHFSTRPIHEENMAMRGDPTAQATMARLRTLNPDDALVQRHIRQAGGRPDAPLAIGGRQEKTVERMLARSQPQLHPTTRLMTLQTQMSGFNTPHVPPGAALQPAVEAGGGLFNTLREKRFRDAPAALSKFFQAAKGPAKYIWSGK